MFFRNINFALNSYLKTQNAHSRTKLFQTLDAFGRLVVLIVKHAGEPSASKINMLNKVC